MIRSATEKKKEWLTTKGGDEKKKRRCTDSSERQKRGSEAIFTIPSLRKKRMKESGSPSFFRRASKTGHISLRGRSVRARALVLLISWFSGILY